MKVSGIDADKIENALKDENFEDFEDCLQKECAAAVGAEYIVTRNGDDFINSTVPCISPSAFGRIIN